VNTSVLASPVFSALAASLIVLLVGDFASTFFYHVPQHAWGKLHLRTHHDRRRSYWDHAVLSRDPQVLLDGFLGAVPYIVLALLCAVISVPGAILGLLLGQAHVWWRHTTELGWRTPAWFVRIARAIGLVLPEDHDGHHRNPEIEFGDIFRFYDVPARALLVTLRSWTRAVVRKRSRRSTPVRRAAALKRRAVAKQS
jgi:sterol desaturase/sphingolipid hydroxylase (fatty acid hydroxylase superfamily)